MVRVASFLVAGALAASGGVPAAANDSATPLTGFNLTSWTQKDGLASSLIWSLAQDAVGYLWVGTDAGLLRFDGVRFVSWEAVASPSNARASVRSLLAARDGAIWFGLGEPGGVGSLRNGEIRIYGPADGLPEGIVTALAERADGSLLAAGRFGVFRLQAHRWVPDADGLPADGVNAMVLEPDGTLLVATTSGVYERAPGAAAFARVGEYADVARSFARDRQGRLWTTDAIVGLRPVSAGTPSYRGRLQGRGSRLLRDSKNSLWVGTGGQGLWRIRHDAPGSTPLERTSTAMGLSDDGVTDLLEDRDGNIWVATRDGLNRLTPHKMTPITDLGLVNAVEATPDGRVLVGTAEGVVIFDDGRIESRRPPIRLVDPPLVAMHADRTGTLWVATARQLIRIIGDEPRAVPLLGAPIVDLTDITSDGADGLWLHDATHGLWHWRDGQLSASPVPSSLKPIPLLASHTDRDGRAWFAYENRQVVVIDPAGGMRLYGERDGLTGGPYRAIHQDRSGAIWLGGNALTRFADGVFATMAPFGGDASQTITAIVDDKDAALWVAINGSGLIRLSREELALSLLDRKHTPRFSAYDKVDGSAGTSRWFGNRAGVRASDNRLWFVAGRGVTVVDAAVLATDVYRPANRLRIEGAVVDGRLVESSAPGELPPRTVRVQIHYTVLDLTAPHKTRFRHRLEGFDADWINAGSRHSAFYTNLPPREYVFQVMASGADGSFVTPAAEWRFVIRPMFYQRWWFPVACLGGVAAATGATWRLHLHRVRKQFVMLLGERARLSREVHDTLLQSMFGVALECDALHAAMPASEPQLRDRLKRLRRRLEADIREARQSIWNLRSPLLEAQGLVAAIREVTRQRLESTGLRVDFELAGEPRDAPPEVEEQLMRIGSEAISNVVRHACASAVRVGLSYLPHAIALTVADDGRGFDPASHSHRRDHLGLTAMRERATSMGGTLHVDSGPGRGTTVTAVIPARAA